MKKIRTITLNPVFDLHYDVPDFSPGRENLVSAVERYAGGKGVNTARALAANGIDSIAYVVVGTENGESFLSCLAKDGVAYRAFHTPGRIREGITVHPRQGRETRLAVNTFRVDDDSYAALEAALLAEDLPHCLFSFSGRLPEGVDKERVLSLLARLIAGGAGVVVDCASLTRSDLCRLRAWFIKPNEQEAQALCGMRSATVSDAAEAVRALVAQGVSETAMISLGAKGAVYADREDTYFLRVPPLNDPPSTIGAGDSAIAGLLAAAARGTAKEDRVRLAMAYGTAACMTRGTLPPRPADVETLLPQIKIERV